MKKILLIDGYSIINRAFYGIPMLNNAQGTPTNAIYGFLAIMFKALEVDDFTHIAVAFDVKKPTFRHEMYDMYKGNRKPMPEELTKQVPLVRELLEAMNITCIDKPGYEADDILGTMAVKAEKAGFICYILSGDRDLLQMATDKIHIINPRTKAGKTEHFIYDADGVRELYGVSPTEFIDMKALMGDTSDNIPGLPGVGEKTAGALIAKYKCIEECYAHLDEIKPAKAQKAFAEHYDLAVLSKKLAAICTEVPDIAEPDELLIHSFANAKSYELAAGYHFKSLMQHFTPASSEERVTEKTADIITITDLPGAISIFDTVHRLADNNEKFSIHAAAINDKYYGCSICISDNEIYYIPAYAFTNEEWQKTEIIKLLNKGVISINSRNLFELLEGEERFMMTNIEDVHIMAYLLEPLSSGYGYSEIAYTYLGIDFPSEKEIFDKKSFRPDTEDADEKIMKYSAYSAYTAFRSFDILMEGMEKRGLSSLYNNIEKPLASALYRCEQHGIIAKSDELKEYSNVLSLGIKELEDKIYEAAGVDFNINSPKQLGEILFEKMGISGGKKTKTGYSTSAEVLDKLAVDYPFVRDILSYRQLSKLKSTYADALGGYISADGRIHCRFHQTITATGRISCSDPNLQNIPVRMELGRRIRKLFVPREGCVFVDADYSQIELRILAHLSNDEKLLEAYRGAKDIHAATAAAVFHVPLEEVTPELRRKAKAVNFGIVYGISTFGLSEDLDITRKEAEDIIQRYFEEYPGVKQFLDKQVSDAKENGYITTMYGRIRPIPELKASQYMQRMFGERVAMNSPIQGSAADIMKLAMLNTEKELKNRGLKSIIVLQVHDELLLECPEEEVAEVKELLKKAMSDYFDLRVYLEISVSEGKSWYETK